jgi:hypothetical protein
MCLWVVDKRNTHFCSVIVISIKQPLAELFDFVKFMRAGLHEFLITTLAIRLNQPEAARPNDITCYPVLHSSACPFSKLGKS